MKYENIAQTLENWKFWGIMYKGLSVGDVGGGVERSLKPSL